MSTNDQLFCPPEEVNLRKLVIITGEEPGEIRRCLGLPEEEITTGEAAARYKTLGQAIKAWNEIDRAHPVDHGQEFLAVIALLKRRLSKVKSLDTFVKITHDLMSYHLRALPGEINELFLAKMLAYVDTIDRLAGLFREFQILPYHTISALLKNECESHGQGSIEAIYPHDWDSRFDAMVHEKEANLQGAPEHFKLALILHDFSQVHLIEDEFATDYYRGVLGRATLVEALEIFQRFHHKHFPWPVMALQRIARLQQ